jgi:acetyl-CoA/propionyl-CoA carboxylase biotin carboxyl carrier protein
VTLGPRPIRRLYVANRGEIARRITTTAERLGIEAVVPDLEAPDAVDLLSASSIVAAATAAGADAVHPGYGFLAETPLLAAAVVDAGLTWVGPPAEACRALGDKAEARAIARRAGVPVAEGAEPDDQSDASLIAAAVAVGHPVLIKPVGGGGGKGIRVVLAPDALPEALASARREASRAFNDPRLLVERYIPDARHVEVQVLADAHGGVVHLADRDCSLQRRHQKVIEEAPAPGLDRDLRRGLWDAAVALARAAGYVNAGTCEFLVAPDGSFVFLELNARLQVEHPVTELVLGRDLVADQLGIAGGATLAELGLDPATIEAALASGGAAIEARLNAEDPAAGFLPSTGRAVAIRWPDGAVAFGPTGATGVRVDAGIDEGAEVTGRFDPLLAKVIATAPDRATALARLAGALDETELLGLPTNLAFLRRLVRLPVVLDARATTTSIETDPAIRDAAAASAPGEAGWTVAARLLAADVDGAFGGSWRLNGPRRVRLEMDGPDGTTTRAIDLDDGPPGDAAPLAALDDDTAWISVDGRSVAFRRQAPPVLGPLGDDPPGAGDGPAELPSPMPGLVIGVHVRQGDHVTAGDRIVTLEAMKMEHVVTAPGPGTVEAVLVHEGQQVERGRPVARLGAGT